MFWCLVRLSTEALSGGLYANPLEMAIQSAVAYSEVKDGGLLVSWQLMEFNLVWVVSSSLAVEDSFLFISDKSFGFSVGHIALFMITGTWQSCQCISLWTDSLKKAGEEEKGEG